MSTESSIPQNGRKSRLLMRSSFGLLLLIGIFSKNLFAQDNLPREGNKPYVIENSYGFTIEETVANKYGKASYSLETEASGNLILDDTGGEINLKTGLAAKLEAASESFGFENENVGATAQIAAEVEALIGAEGKIGAHIDDHGITIGAEATAGAFVSGEAELNINTHLLGVKADIRVYASGAAGVMASGEAILTIGFDGTITMKAGAGVVAGIGGEVGVEVIFDASDLIKKMGLNDIRELIKWADTFISDPREFANEILKNITDTIIENIDKKVQEALDDLSNYINSFLLPQPLFPQSPPPVIPGSNTSAPNSQASPPELARPQETEPGAPYEHKTPEKFR